MPCAGEKHVNRSDDVTLCRSGGDVAHNCGRLRLQRLRLRSSDTSSARAAGEKPQTFCPSLRLSPARPNTPAVCGRFRCSSHLSLLYYPEPSGEGRPPVISEMFYFAFIRFQRRPAQTVAVQCKLCLVQTAEATSNSALVP